MKIANVAVNMIVVAACLLSSADVVRNLLTARNATSTLKEKRAWNPPGPHPNEVINIPGKDWGSKPVSVILAVSKTCRFCTESAPFYRRLFSAARSMNVPVTVITNDPDPQKTRDHFAELQVPMPELTSVSFPAVGIKVMPTLAIIDKTGRISAVRSGTLQPEEEQEMLNAISRSSPTAH